MSFLRGKLTIRQLPPGLNELFTNESSNAYALDARIRFIRNAVLVSKPMSAIIFALTHFANNIASQAQGYDFQFEEITFAEAHDIQSLLYYEYEQWNEMVGVVRRYIEQQYPRSLALSINWYAYTGMMHLNALEAVQTAIENHQRGEIVFRPTIDDFLARFREVHEENANGQSGNFTEEDGSPASDDPGADGSPAGRGSKSNGLLPSKMWRRR